MFQSLVRMKLGSLVQCAIAMIAIVGLLFSAGPQQTLALEEGSTDIAGNIGPGGGRAQEAMEGRFTGGAALLPSSWQTLSSPESLLAPAGSAVDKSGNIYVVAAGNDRIDVYAGNGSYLESWGDTGSGPGEFVFHDANAGWSYGDIAIDDDGNFYIADPGNHRVQVFNTDRDYVKTIESKVYPQSETVREKLGYVDPFLQPAGLAIDNESDRLYIADAATDTIKVYGLDGRALNEWGMFGPNTPSFGDLFDVAVAADGSVWTADFAKSMVVHLSPEGEQLQVIGSHGLGATQFTGAVSVAIDANGNLLVADLLEGDVQVILADGTFANAIDVDLGSPTYVTVAPDGSILASYEDNNTVARFMMEPLVQQMSNLR